MFYIQTEGCFLFLAKRKVDFIENYGYRDRWNFFVGQADVSGSNNLQKRFYSQNNKRRYEDKVCYLSKKGDQRSVECPAKAGLRYPEMLFGEYLLHSGH